jgi:hypothetical protein
MNEQTNHTGGQVPYDHFMPSQTGLTAVFTVAAEGKQVRAEHWPVVGYIRTARTDFANWEPAVIQVGTVVGIWDAFHDAHEDTADGQTYQVKILDADNDDTHGIGG